MGQSVRARNLAAVECAVATIHHAPHANYSIIHLAQVAGLSPRRFHSLFSEVSGETIGAYVRRARLEYAVGLMRLSPPLPLTEIALRAGYSELSDFSRSFQKRFECAPSEWDRVEPLNSGKNCQAAVGQQDYPWRGFPPCPTEQKPRVEITSFQPMRFAVLKIPQAHENNILREGFDKLEHWARANGVENKDKSFVGLAYHDLFSTEAALIDFDLAYPVSEAVEGSGEIFIRNLPAFKAATIHSEGGLAEFATDWDSLMRGWLPASGYRRAHMPTMEIYYNDPRASDMTYWDMDCVLPVTPLEL